MFDNSNSLRNSVSTTTLFSVESSESFSIFWSQLNRQLFIHPSFTSFLIYQFILFSEIKRHKSWFPFTLRIFDPNVVRHSVKKPPPKFPIQKNCIYFLWNHQCLTFREGDGFTQFYKAVIYDILKRFVLSISIYEKTLIFN